MFDYIIVGSGLAGTVLAERIANKLNKSVLIIEKRNHVGGNCFDYYDENGILVHKYGPHIFRTSSKKVWDYLSNFTEWNLYQHEVLGFIDGKKVPIPFNLNTLRQILPKSMATILEKKIVEKFGYDTKIPILELRNTQDKELRFLADFIYEKIFLNYTKKQWGMIPEDLDPSVTGRVPVFISTDNRYFQDHYQGVPKGGYGKLFERLLSNKNIKITLNANFREILSIDYENSNIRIFGQEFHGKVIYTGKIDEFFNYELGELPYRSLKFDFETIDKEYFQEVGTVNYPNDYEFTRITEFKHLTGQKNPKTVIAKEYPLNYDKNVDGKDIPYYPIPKKDNLDLYGKYKEKADKVDNVIFIGRLAEYKYYEMGVLISEALEVFEENLL